MSRRIQQYRYGCFDKEGVFRILMEVRDYELDQFGEVLCYLATNPGSVF